MIAPHRTDDHTRTGEQAENPNEAALENQPVHDRQHDQYEKGSLTKSRIVAGSPPGRLELALVWIVRVNITAVRRHVACLALRDAGVAAGLAGLAGLSGI
jgi:hypothetical protein